MSETPLTSSIDERITVNEITQHYLFGIDLSDDSGNPFPMTLVTHYLDAAIDYLQTVVDIQIPVVDVEETHDYFMEDYTNWGFLQLFKKPVLSITKLCMVYGQHESFNIPLDWIKLEKTSGQINLFPSHGSAEGLIINTQGVFVGLFNRWDYAPHYWKVEYRSGMEVIPDMIKEFIYKKAAQNILHVWGDLIIGAGIANQSVSLDGLSQSIGTTQSAMFGGASARIEAYQKDLDRLLPAIRSKYEGLRMIVV